MVFFFKVSNQADQFVKPQSMSWQSASHLPHYSEETLQVPPKKVSVMFNNTKFLPEHL